MVTTSQPQNSSLTMWTPDVQFIVGMVCVGIGAILLIIAILWILMFIVRTKKGDDYVRRKIQTFERRRHLENYYKNNHDEDSESIVIGGPGTPKETYIGRANDVHSNSNKTDNGEVNNLPDITVNGSNNNHDMNGSAHAEGIAADVLY